MECRDFQLTLISAYGLQNVRNSFRMKVYASVSIGGKPETQKQTLANKHNELNPAWNHTVKYTVGEGTVQQDGVMVVIKLYCKRKLGDRYIGEVGTSIKCLFDHANQNGRSGRQSFPVQRGSEKSQGVLEVAYRFGEIEIIKEPSFWMKLLLSGTALLVQLTLVSTVGIDIPIRFDYDKVDAA